MYECVVVSVSVSPFVSGISILHVSEGRQGGHKNIRSFGVGVTGICEQSKLGGEN